jgi:uncharacterized membrane protein (Fun14 family)
MYLEQQGMVNINWDKINVVYHGVLSTITNTISNSTVSRGIGGSHTAASSFLPVRITTMTDLGIPLTGSMATGFTIGIIKG